MAHAVARLKTRRLARIMKALANEHRLSLYLGIAENEESDF